jgi:PIN domain nuclease of toxin-antitoxin system
MKEASRRWVCSKLPITEPEPDMPETNSTISSSTTDELTVPSAAMAWEISLTSSSSRLCQRRV